MSPSSENASLRARVKPVFVSNGASWVASNDENGDDSEVVGGFGSNSLIFSSGLIAAALLFDWEGCPVMVPRSDKLMSKILSIMEEDIFAEMSLLTTKM